MACDTLCTHFDLSAYTNSDFSISKSDRKNTSGACFFLESCFGSCMCKKQSFITFSTTEAEYISAGLGCALILWMQHTLKDYGLYMNESPLDCDSTSAININKNPVLHSRTKHIEVKYHFIREHVQEGDIDIQYIPIDQHGGILTKPLGVKGLQNLGMTWHYTQPS